MFNFIAPYRKAIVAGFVTLALGLLLYVNITPQMTVEQALTVIGGALVNLLLVFSIPNTPK